jgi:stage II sporulation protein D
MAPLTALPIAIRVYLLLSGRFWKAPSFIILALYAAFFSCASAPVYTASSLNSETVKTQKYSKEANIDSVVEPQSLQVAPVPLEEQKNENDVWGLGEQQDTGMQVKEKTDSSSALTFMEAPNQANVCVLLRQNEQETRIATSLYAVLKNGGNREGLLFRGKAQIERGDAAGRVFIKVDGHGRIGVALPCTLQAKNEFCIISVEDAPYRGALIITPEPHGLFTLVNYIGVEDYLRGVVPLEVGRGSDDVVEAIKAQAVAARTYTYRKMRDNEGLAWDLAATVADQVYGGVGAETEQCNRAILATAGEVMLYRDTIIYAYYHSTCGGRTANIENVWNKPALGYLRSREDKEGMSDPFCRQSPSFTWEEQWPIPQFSFLVNRFSREAFPQNPLSGEVRSVSVGSRFLCGRVRQCVVNTGSGAFWYGGDKLRFVFRRNSPGSPILKSSIITDVSVRAGTVFMKGRGYGHGVGMCQMGALGRARAGKKYVEILKAYYTDVTIKKVTR